MAYENWWIISHKITIFDSIKKPCPLLLKRKILKHVLYIRKRAVEYVRDQQRDIYCAVLFSCQMAIDTTPYARTPSRDGVPYVSICTAMLRNILAAWKVIPGVVWTPHDLERTLFRNYDLFLLIRLSNTWFFCKKKSLQSCHTVLKCVFCEVAFQRRNTFLHATSPSAIMSTIRFQLEHQLLFWTSPSYWRGKNTSSPLLS